MDNSKLTKGRNLLVDINGMQSYGAAEDFDLEKAKDLDYLTDKICEMLKRKHTVKPSFDAVLMDNLRLYFPKKYVEAAQVIMAISIFKSFREQGLLTEDEYREITRDEEKHWRGLLYGDSMRTNRVV